MAILDHPAVVSRLPGRIRLRHPALRAPARHQDLAARLERLGTVTGNPAVGSLLVRFDPADSSVGPRIDAVLADMLPVAATTAAPAAPGGRRPLKRDINRAAKIGALLSLALSLAALPASRRLHAQAGAVFVALTLLHIGVHWRQTLR